MKLSSSTLHITLHNMLPVVFSDGRRHHIESDIWLQPDIEFNQPGRYLLRAESGRGKSSLCAYLYGKRNDYTGSLIINSQDAREITISGWTRLRRDTIAYLPQEAGLFPSLTAMENILLKNRLTDCKTAAEIEEMLRMTGMDGFANKPAGHLSIGQQQRVALIRALCQPFSLLLLDEPVSHLDNNANIAVSNLVDRELKNNNAAAIVTSVGNDLKLEGCERLTL